MAALKDSGIEWIGKIPENWNCLRIKNLSDPLQENSFIDGDWIESPDISTDGIRYLTTGNVGDGKFKRQGNGFVSLETFNRLNCKFAYPNDLVIARLNAPYGRACILPDDYAEYVLAVDIVILRTKHNKRFLCYSMQTEGYQKAVEDDAKGTTMQRISRTNLGKIKLPVPPLTEQQRIADFLDKKCAEIDAAIEATQATIEEYKTLKQSVITEAVTKGVRGPRPMKDSGIEWLGRIPRDWKTIRIKYLLKERNERSEFGQEEPLSMSQKFGLVPTKELDMVPNMAASFVGAKLAYVNDLVFNKLKAHLGVFSVSKYNGLVSPDYAVYYSTGKAHLKYLEYIFKTPQCIIEFRKKSTGIAAGLTRLYTDGLFSIVLPFPSMSEQQEIVDELSRKCTEMDRLIAAKEQFVTELESYKKSVIYEYVTGKKEVPAV